MVAVEGNFIIGAVTEKFRLVPFYMDLHQPDRVKIDKNTGNAVAIPHYVADPDPLNNLFYEQYNKFENIYWAQTENYNSIKNRCIRFAFTLLEKYIPSVRPTSQFQ